MDKQTTYLIVISEIRLSLESQYRTQIHQKNLFQV